MSKRLEGKYKYRRKLPHWVPAKGTFFVTINLYGALPKAILGQKQITQPDTPHKWEWQRQRFLQLENWLHKRGSGPYWLHDEAVARLVFDSILFRNNKLYDLDCFTLMGNHIHMVFSLAKTLNPEGFNNESLGAILHSLKSYTGREANKIINKDGSFWQPESFDRWIRTPEEFHKVVNYVLDNPVKAGLVQDWRDWPWTWHRALPEGLDSPKQTNNP